MTTGAITNLDYLAANHAQQIISSATGESASDIDNTVTRSLGVLQENGFYAFALYLLSRNQSEQKRASIVLKESMRLLAGLGFGWEEPPNYTNSTVLEHISETMLDDLERLLLAKETVEQMLTYARYGAKAKAREG